VGEAPPAHWGPEPGGTTEPGGPTEVRPAPPWPPADLAGRIALVTGASRGIGAATARALDRAGARVVLVARDAHALATVAADLVNEPVVLPADLGDPAEPSRLVQAAAHEAGSVDVLVNNAAVAVRVPITETDPAVIDRMLAVNVRAPILLVAAVVPHMVPKGGGAIVNLSSVSGLVGTPHRAAYAATKGAIDAATRSLAIELGPMGIRVNSVAPGVVDTAMWAANKKVPGVVESVEALTPLGRWATPDDVAAVVTFLASDAARFVTGETIAADGGMAHTLDLYG
jgi:NAD(P)-dependent dehydrogenase (short-subunit alcohol dehydrogenase family)